MRKLVKCYFYVSGVKAKKPYIHFIASVLLKTLKKFKFTFNKKIN